MCYYNKLILLYLLWDFAKMGFKNDGNKQNSKSRCANYNMYYDMTVLFYIKTVKHIINGVNFPVFIMVYI